MTVVLDCNILVMCLTSKSPWHFIFQALVKGNFTLIVSESILFEYQEIIQVKYGIPTANSFIALLEKLPNVQHVNPYYNWHLISADADDDKYCDCAIAGKADYIVTEDNHFSVLKRIPFPKLSLLNLEEFGAKLKSS